MVKIVWQLKKTKGDPKKPEFEVVRSGDILGDRAVMVTMNKYGDCGMAALGMPLTEVLGAIREVLNDRNCLMSSMTFLPKTDEDVTLAVDIRRDEAKPDEVEHLEYLRAVILTISDSGFVVPLPFNISRPECEGILEITLMLQLLNMGMQNALTQAATRPQAARMMPPLGPSGFGGVTGRLIPPR